MISNLMDFIGKFENETEGERLMASEKHKIQETHKNLRILGYL